MIMSIDINSIAILNIHGVDYLCIIDGISKSEAMNLLIIADLSEEHYKVWFFIIYKKGI